MLEIKNVTAGYGKQPVLNGVNATFEKGKLTSIIGVNGCGKSTLLKVMLGILPITDGIVEIDGRALSSLKRNEIAQRIAYLSQGKNTPDMTVMQMVLHGRFPYLSYPRRYTSRDREIAFSAMEKVGIADLAEKPLYSLSGGKRQNAYIAMTLAQDTDYILLDEPTTYLDIAHQLDLMRILRELADGGKGVITVMHDLPMAFSFSDKIILMNEGEILCGAAPEQIYQQNTIPQVFGVVLNRSEDGQSYSYSYKY